MRRQGESGPGVDACAGTAIRHGFHAGVSRGRSWLCGFGDADQGVPLLNRVRAGVTIHEQPRLERGPPRQSRPSDTGGPAFGKDKP
jgi:hypothetical protein